MTDQNLEANVWEDETNKSMKERRGSFLNVICILSWVWIGLMLFSTLFTYMNGTDSLEQSLIIMEEASEQANNAFVESMMGGSVEMLNNQLENFTVINLSTILFLLIGGLAVYLMFNLKRNGFFLYILYCIAGPVITVMFLGTSQPAVWGLTLDIFVSIGFIIMYAVNLKRMTA